ncbi:alpha/beta hydrolase [Pseudomonas aeruginosa]|uniref:alpha/beta hydrolase n=1 Tax=Pseudomonas aeruginosa TaxID=287 RepID=UPI0031B71ACC
MSVEQVIEKVRSVYGSWGRQTSVEQMRADWDRLFGISIPDGSMQPVDAGGVPAAWISAPSADVDRVLVYFHGGGFQVGSVHSHFDLMYRLSAAARCRVLAVDYRLAPEHRFPAALEDALAAYEWLLGQGIAAERTALAGDSAGGGLALSLLLQCRDRGLPMPACAAVMSAWTDMAANGGSYISRAASDPIHQRRMVLAMAANYLGEQDPLDPRVSPLHGDLSGLPPLLLQVGDRETVLDDSRLFARKAQAAGVSVELQVYDGMIHVFQQFPRQLQQALDAIAKIGRHLDAHWSDYSASFKSQTQEGLRL